MIRAESPPRLTVIVPALNESGNVRIVVDESKRVLDAEGLAGRYEFILVNDGSEDECGFFGFLQFVPAGWLAGAREDVMRWVESDRKYSVESPNLYREVYPELSTDEWVAIGYQGYADQLALHTKTGRVFQATKGVPAIRLVAPSLEAYLESYANDLEAGRYHVEEGFGGAYLER